MLVAVLGHLNLTWEAWGVVLLEKVAKLEVLEKKRAKDSRSSL